MAVYVVFALKNVNVLKNINLHNMFHFQSPKDRHAISFNSHQNFKYLSQPDRVAHLSKLVTKRISLMQFRDACYKTVSQYTVLRVLITRLHAMSLLPVATEEALHVS